MLQHSPPDDSSLRDVSSSGLNAGRTIRCILTHLQRSWCTSMVPARGAGRLLLLQWAGLPQHGAMQV